MQRKGCPGVGCPFLAVPKGPCHLFNLQLPPALPVRGSACAGGGRDCTSCPHCPPFSSPETAQALGELWSCSFVLHAAGSCQGPCRGKCPGHREVWPLVAVPCPPGTREPCCPLLAPAKGAGDKPWLCRSCRAVCSAQLSVLHGRDVHRVPWEQWCSEGHGHCMILSGLDSFSGTPSSARRPCRDHNPQISPVVLPREQA